MFQLNGRLSSDTAAEGADVLQMKSALHRLGEYQPPAHGITEWPDQPLFDGMKRFQARSGLRVDGMARPGGPTETAIKAQLANQTITHTDTRTGGTKAAPKPYNTDPPAGGAPANDIPANDIGAITGRIKERQQRWQATSPSGSRPAQNQTPTRSRDNPLSQAALTLSGGVGTDQSNRPGDVIGLKNALAWTGHYPVDLAQRRNPLLDEALIWGLHGFQRDFGLKQDGLSRPGGETEARLNELVTPMIQLASTNTPSQSTDQMADANPYEKSGEQHADAGEASEKDNKETELTLESIAEAIKDTALDTAEGALRLGAQGGRALGLNNAADSLDHFLDGTGTDRTYTRDQARERSFIREAEEKNQSRFEDSLETDKVVQPDNNSKIRYNYREQILDMADGETRQILPEKPDNATGPADKWDRESGYARNARKYGLDEALAFGSNEFTSEIRDGFTATREGNIVIVTGVINHHWNDQYDFDGESSPDPVMHWLRDNGRASEYNSNAAWAQKMTVRYKIENGELVKESVEWEDLEAEVGP